MKRVIYSIIIFVALSASTAPTFAGNPDRQGEAGAYELLMNPWARSAGLHTLGTSLVTGVEGMRLNPAGLARINRTELLFGHGRYLVGTDINMNAFGFSQKLGKSGALGVSIMALSFGEIPVTTEDQPEGTGAVFSPNWFNVGLGYSHVFENKVSVGLVFRAIAESTSEVSAFGFSIDAGVQYVTGPKDNMKFGIALRNVGSPMSFKGEGLTENLDAPDSEGNYNLSYFVRAQDFELPSELNIGLSYDFYLAAKHRLTAVGNFTANSFSRDQVGLGLEYSLNEFFMLRGAYKYEFGSQEEDGIGGPLYTGPAAGFTLQVPTSKKGEGKFAIDYGYTVSKIFDGTHNLGVRFSL